MRGRAGDIAFGNLSEPCGKCGGRRPQIGRGFDCQKSQIILLFGIIFQFVAAVFLLFRSRIDAMQIGAVQVFSMLMMVAGNFSHGANERYRQVRQGGVREPVVA